MDHIQAQATVTVIAGDAQAGMRRLPVVQRQNQAGEIYHVASTPGLLGKALEGDFPEVIRSCLPGGRRSGVLQQGTITVESSAITMAIEVVEDFHLSDPR